MDELQRTKELCRRLRVALIGLVGVENEAESDEELRAMESIIRLTPAPEKDKAVMIDAIHILIETRDMQ